MRVILYQYNGDNDVANKLSECEKMFDSNDVDFEIYGGFSPYAAEFELSELYSANYARYYYGGVWYYGSVVTSTTSRGLYKYNVTVDPLTTAWYSGCMDVDAMIGYSSSPDYMQIDRRIPLAEHARLIEVKKPSGSGMYTDWAIVLNVLNTRAEPPYRTDTIANQTPSNIDTYIFPDAHYLMDFGQENATGMFTRFLRLAADIDTIPFINLKSFYSAMISAYVIPKAFCVEVPSPLPSDHYVTLNALPDNLVNNEIESVCVNPKTEEQKKYDYVAIHIPKNIDARHQYEWSIGSDMKNALIWNSVWSIYVPFANNITFVPASCLPDTADKVGVTVSINYVGAFYTMTLRYHDEADGLWHERDDHHNTTNILETIPIPTNNAESNTLTQGIGLAISTMASAYAQNYAASANGVISMTSSISDSMFGSLSVSGGANGGSVARNNIDTAPVLYVSYRPYESNQDVFADRFGYPYNEVDNIQNQPTGYVQTRDAVLKRQGLPEDIVTAAQDMCNSGFRKV